MVPQLSARLKRITTGSSWIPEIDGLRFVAITAVVLFHLSAELYSRSGHTFGLQSWYGPIFAVISQGHIGVLLFFVISGFILGRPFARQYLLGQGHVSLRSYYLRRVTRLEPPYLLNLLLLTVAILLYEHESVSRFLPHLAASSVYLHGWIYHAVSTINPVAWTLEVEVQFYLLVPLLTLVFRLRRACMRRLLLLLAIPLIAYVQQRYLWQQPPDSLVWASILFYLQYFVAGLLLSDLYVLAMPKWPLHWLWDAASLIAWPVIFLGNAPWLYRLQPLLILVCYIAAFRGVLFRRFFRIQWVALLGGMCYSMYLWHFFVIALIFKASRRLILFHDFMADFAVQCAVILPFIVLITVTYYMLIERPCMDPRWPQKLKAALSSRPKRLPVA